MRWIGRFALEVRTAGLGDLREAAEALKALRDQPDGVMERLAALCARHHVGYP